LTFRSGSQSIKNFCDGKWERSSIPDVSSYPIIAARSHYNSSTSTESSLEFINTACPAQVAHYTCYYHGDTKRAQNIEFKRFIPDPPTTENEACLPFHPVEFLELIRNKEVIFYGDSILGNLWTSLFCSLYSTTHSTYSINFIKLDKCDELLCPLGEASHSYNHGGSIKFEHFNVTMHYMLVNTYDSNFVKFIDMNKDKIIIYNVGLHYNDEKQFDHDMEEAASALSTYFNSKRQQNESLPLLFFAESSPQHFPVNPNGYYDQLTQNYIGIKQCLPIIKEGETGHDSQSIYQADWRNRLVEKHFQTLLQQGAITLIPWAKGLYDQYDQHLEIFTFLLCTI
jgi:hypothetical protein